MQIFFLARDRNLLESIASVEEVLNNVLVLENLGDLERLWNKHRQWRESEGIIFVDFDDPEFSLPSLFELNSRFFDTNSGKKMPFLTVLISKRLSVRDFKKLTVEYKFINALLRAPIKLKDIETFVEDYMLVLNETEGPMAEPKKKDLDDPVNAKIQRKFDLIFSSPKMDSSDEHKSTVFNHGVDNTLDDQFDDELNLDGDMPMSTNTQKKPSLDLDMDQDSTGTSIEFDGLGASESFDAPPASPQAAKLAVVPAEEELGFSLDFGDDTSEVPSIPSVASADLKKEATQSDSHFELDLSGGDDISFELDQGEKAQETAGTKEISVEANNEMDDMFDAAIADAQNHLSPEGTQKTIVYDKSQLTDIGLNSFDNEVTGSTNSSADLMSSEEAKANIDATIKDILRPKNLDSTQEIDISEMSHDEDLSGFELESSQQSSGTPSIGFNLKNIPSANTNNSNTSSSGEFDLSSMEFADKDKTEEIKRAVPVKSAVVESFESSSASSSRSAIGGSGHSSFVSDEESTRFQATIRQLREEREELVNQIKTMKNETRELEQDNLTLKAALDESKIEVSILRKRHMVELEDVKYRLSLSEDKKALALEQARMAESKREKLEQRVRIDFNQVKQREKELETKLEMLSIDVDSQVQSRDQKILELRRKIDALEFNMENVSIKEQKSHDDKRKLEDKLNKIMKTLRHSIKNLEDDIDQVTDEAEDERNEEYRSNKA